MDIAALQTAVIKMLTECCVDDDAIAAIKGIFEDALVPVCQPVVILDEPVVTNVAIAKFHKLLPEQIDWRQNNIYSFNLAFIVGRVYRWVTVFFDHSLEPTAFLLESGAGISAEQIRKAVIAGGTRGIPMNSQLGRVFTKEALRINFLSVGSRLHQQMAILTANVDAQKFNQMTFMPAGILR